ncbi:hypothetical protein QCA50_001389 [Cerrena zonata]|uniref:lipoyl(octanoyl) transferase n=1 Tax=Cerrena zonata TaxID=2478898 RepID=A0AAW0GX50_9APHY
MTSSLPPVLYHFFRYPVPYGRTLLLQEKLHALQLAQRRQSQSHNDYLLLLQHRPVYTTGRRQIATSPEVLAEETRLTQIGADFVTTQRGGQLTYHGPGQIVGYPLMDLGRTTPTLHTRDYICKMQKLLERHLKEQHGIKTIPSDHTGVFLDEYTKVASIGVQVRHRLTTHGFAFNVTPEPKRWFDRVVACGLDGVRAGCIADVSFKKESISVEDEIPPLVEGFGRAYERKVEKLDPGAEGEAGELIMELEEAAKALGPWPEAPSPESH